MSKVSIEITPNKAVIELEFRGKTYSEEWIREPLGYGTTGKCIESQMAEVYDEDFTELFDLLETVNDLDVSEVLEKLNNLQEAN